MESWHWAVLLRPLFLLILFVLIVIPLEVAFIRWFPEGRIKRFLLNRW